VVETGDLTQLSVNQLIGILEKNLGKEHGELQGSKPFIKQLLAKTLQRSTSSPNRKQETEAPKRLFESDSSSQAERSVKVQKVEKPVKTEGDGNVQLSKMRRASLSDFRGNTYVNIREYYTDSEGQEKPGRKGIALNSKQFTSLTENIDQLSEALESEDELKVCLGAKKFAYVKMYSGRAFIDLREFYGDEELKPGKKGILLPKDQWEKLKSAIKSNQLTLNMPPEPPSNKKIQHKDNAVSPKQPTKTVQNDADVHLEVKLGSKRYARVRTFNARKLVDVREFYGEEPNLKPGTKGLSMNKTVWAALYECHSDIDVALEEKTESMFELSNKKRARVSEFHGQFRVDLREFYGDENDLKPGRKGISLSQDQWNALCTHIDSINTLMNE